MGCVSSKQKCCHHCRRPYSPISRSYSMQVHHPPQAQGDSYHVVALTSSTLGSLELGINGDFRNGLAEAKAWSSLITEKLPKTAPVMPAGEPETINTWELMEGLEDLSPHRSPSQFRSLSFDFGTGTTVPIPKQIGADSSPKPLWLQLKEEEVDEVDDENLNSDYDPEFISAKRFCNNWPEVEKKKKSDRVILYFTSLRGVRKTYEDCCHVRAILKAVGVRVDERDVSMHSGFKEELKGLLMEDENKNGGRSLPRVFIERKQIGGAEEIRRLQEDGQLEKLLECCEKLDDGDGGVCEGCGDVRFVPCETCCGSCKVFYEEEEEEEQEDEYGFQRCVDCNENGLVRCSICCH